MSIASECTGRIRVPPALVHMLSRSPIDSAAVPIESTIPTIESTIPAIESTIPTIDSAVVPIASAESRTLDWK